MSGQQQPEVVTDFDRLNKATCFAQGLAAALRDSTLAEAAAQVALLLNSLDYQPTRPGATGRSSTLDPIAAVVREHVLTNLTLMTCGDGGEPEPALIWPAQEAIEAVRTFWPEYVAAVVEDAISAWAGQVAA